MANPEAVEAAVKIPKSANEFWSLILALVAVCLLVQIGAPLIREIEFLDPKLRDYFIGISFALFPFIHRGCKQGLVKFNIQQPVQHHDSAPWYVTGAMAGALIFGWNQFVSVLSGLSLMTLLEGINSQPHPEWDITTLTQSATIAAIVVVMPLTAIAAGYAGVLLNRYTRSHTFWAAAIAAICLVGFNTFTTWLIQPAFFESLLQTFEGEGLTGLAQFLTGFAIVGLIVFGATVLGIIFSRFKSERPIGRIIEAARKLSPAQREALAAELAQRATFAVQTTPQAPTAVEP